MRLSGLLIPAVVSGDKNQPLFLKPFLPLPDGLCNPADLRIHFYFHYLYTCH